jgi:predicted Zn-dependent peptidase
MLQSAKDPYIFEKKEINGVPVYFNHLPWSPCIHIEIGFHVGALQDPVGKEGISHFLEHAVFDGSPLYPTSKEIWAFRKKYTLDSLNAATGFWNTEYTAKCLPEYFDKTLEGMMDFIFKPILEYKEMEREKNVIIQEMWDDLRNEKRIKYKKERLQNIMHGLKASRMSSPGGWPDTVATITAEDLMNWQSSHYHKGNLYIVMTGAVKQNNIDVLEEYLKKIPSGVRSFENKIVENIEKPLISSKTYTSEEIGGKQDHATIKIDRATSRKLKNEEIYTMSAQLLDSIFFEILRQEMGLCYSVTVHSYPMIDFVVNHISVSLSASKVTEAEQKIFDLIENIKNGNFRNKFEEEKKIIIDQARSSERTATSILYHASNDLIYNGKIHTLEELINNVQKINFEDVSKYIGETFKKEEVYVETILP